MKAGLFSYSIDEDKKRYLELLDGKLLLVTNTGETPAEVVQRYRSLADIEESFKVLKSDIEIGTVLIGLIFEAIDNSRSHFILKSIYQRHFFAFNYDEIFTYIKHCFIKLCFHIAKLLNE